MVKGDIVFEQGEPVPSTMFIIADGLVQLFKRAEGEVASALSSGQHFGAYPRE
jgi:CRP-like cAMP-binding protein